MVRPEGKRTAGDADSENELLENEAAVLDTFNFLTENADMEDDEDDENLR